MNSFNVVFSLLPLSFIYLSAVFFFLSFVHVRCEYALEYAVITSLLMFWCFHVLLHLSKLSFYTLDLFYISVSCGQIFRPALKQAY